MARLLHDRQVKKLRKQAQPRSWNGDQNKTHRMSIWVTVRSRQSVLIGPVGPGSNFLSSGAGSMGRAAISKLLEWCKLEKLLASRQVLLPEVPPLVSAWTRVNASQILQRHDMTWWNLVMPFWGPNIAVASDSSGRSGEWCASNVIFRWFRSVWKLMSGERYCVQKWRFSRGLYPELSSLTTRLLESAAKLQPVPQSERTVC